MRFAATLAVPVTGLALILCPVAQADPRMDHRRLELHKVSEWKRRQLSGAHHHQRDD
jgi:hypothetical protein